MKTKISLRFSFLVMLLCVAGTAAAQLDQTCTVAVLNRTTRVSANGFWQLSNVPTNLGLVRARATCVRTGVTTTGVSDFFLVPKDGLVYASRIRFDVPAPIPSSLALTASRTTLNGSGDSVQLSAVVTNPDGSTRDVTATSLGTSYTTSNASVVSVSPQGLATAAGNGVVILSANHEGALGLVRITVGGPTDTDGDGIPDDFELGVGLDPNDPSDAAGDPDNDGLTNLREYQLGTDLRQADTDGDGIRDGLEVQVGTNPVDPLSFDLSLSLRRIDVAPLLVVLRVNPLFGEASQQLVVTGTLLDSFTIDLTSSTRGTTYDSSDLSVCNFGSSDGQIFAGSNGNCTITVSSNGFTAAVPVSVDTFEPTPAGMVGIPGYANNVKVSNGYAFVAAGGAGLQVVDVRDPNNPSLVGSLALPGVAIDLRVRGDLAYIACGEAGLQIVRISTPEAPTLVGSVDTSGLAQDVWLEGPLAYIADGDAGLQIVDVSNPATPLVLGSLVVGDAKGVSVSGTRAVLAIDPDSVAVVDVTSSTAPHLLGTTTVPGQPKDIVAIGTLAYVAAYTEGLQIVDFSTPTAPLVIGGTGQQFVPRDLFLRGNTAIFAEQLFFNAIPFVDVTDPVNPLFRAVIDLGSLGDFAGTGLDVDQQYVYVTAEPFVVDTDYGVDDGNTVLMIARYSSFTDTGGVPPTVQITSPAEGASFVAGSMADVALSVTDDLAPDAATISVNGQIVAVGLRDPYQTTFRVPTAGATAIIRATATDFGNNLGNAAPVTINIIPDPLTTVRGIVRTDTGTHVSGATVVLGGRSATTDLAGAYELTGVPTVNGDIVIAATGTSEGVLMSGRSDPASPVPGGITTADVTIAPLPVGVVATLPLSVPATSVAVSGTTAVLTYGTGEVQTVDVSSPLVPTILTTLPLPGIARAVQASGSYAYVAADAAGFHVIDISDPLQPTLVTTAFAANGAQSLALSGSTLSIAAGSAGFELWDVTNPASPMLLGGRSFARSSIRVTALGTLVAVAEAAAPGSYGGPGVSKVHLMDTSTPSSPSVISDIQVNGDVSGMIITGTSLYISAGNSIFFYDISTPAAPLQKPSPFSGFRARAFAATPTRLVAAGTDPFVSPANIAAVVDLTTTPPRRRRSSFPGSGLIGDALALIDPFAIVTTRTSNGSVGQLTIIKFDGPEDPILSDSTGAKPTSNAKAKKKSGRPR